MQIHELNGFGTSLDATAYVAVDNGNDTGKVNIDTLLAGPNATIAAVEAELNGRIDNIIAGGTAPSEAEIIDARRGANGTNYASLGDAIRGQVSDLQESIDEHSNIISTNLMGIDVQENLYPGAADWSGTWLNADVPHLSLAEETFKGYPVMYYSTSWRSYYKAIPVEAGKTYTFEGWIKPVVTGAIFAYMTNSQTENPATISSNMKQVNGAVAGEWVKLTHTFTCTASGNVTPHVFSGAGGFYFAKYILVEGDAVFSLEDTLNNKASTEDVSAIGDFEKHEFSLGISLGRWWNNTFSKSISEGDKVKLIFDSYSGASELEDVTLYGEKSDGTFERFITIHYPERGASEEATAPNNYTSLRVQFTRVTDENNVTGSVLIATDRELGITYDIMSVNMTRVYHVKKDGSGDFTSLVDAINEACSYMDSIVYVGPGTWDIISELGDAYLNTVSSTKRGLYLKNRVHIICSSEALITCHYTGSREDTITWLSAFNAGPYGFTLENARIESSKCRYSIHDERDTQTDQYINKYINCSIKHDNTAGGFGKCIGGGLGKDGYIMIEGCTFENPNVSNGAIVSYHNTWYAGGDGRSNVEVKGNYFKGSTTFRGSWFGASQEITSFLVYGNSLGIAPIHNAENQSMMDDNPTWIQNTEMLSWNNEIRP